MRQALDAAIRQVEGGDGEVERGEIVAAPNACSAAGASGPSPRSSGAAKRATPCASVVGLAENVVVVAPAGASRTPARGFASE